MGKAASSAADGAAWFGTPVRALVPLDPEGAASEIAELADAARRSGSPRLAALLSKPGPLTDFLAAAFDLSFFLRDCVRRRPEMLERLFDEPLMPIVSE